MTRPDTFSKVRRALLCGIIALPALALPIQDPIAKPKDALADATAKFPWAGEELYFKITVNGAEAAHAVVRVGDVRMLKDQPYVPLSAKAKSVGLFHSIYPMDDRANTFVNPLATFKPLRSEKIFKENGKGRTYKVDYNATDYRAKIHKVYHPDAKHPKERERNFSKAIPSGTHDALSWFFELRSVEKYNEGDVISFFIEDGWKLSRIDLTVIGEERVLTPMGWYTTTRFDFTRESLVARFTKDKDGNPIEPKLRVKKPATPTGSVWLSNDKKRLPVKISMGSTYGLGEVYLAKYTPAKKKSKTRTAKTSSPKKKP